MRKWGSEKGRDMGGKNGGGAKGRVKGVKMGRGKG